MAVRRRVISTFALACLFLSLLSWANKYRLSTNGQSLASTLEVRKRPVQLRALLREPSNGILHLASSKRHHGMQAPLRIPGHSKLEVPHGTVISALHNAIARTQQTLEGDPDLLMSDMSLPPKAPTERLMRDPGQAYLATCLGVKDQNEDLREWIQYHQSIGVGKFYIFDDNSSVPAAEGLQDLIQEGLVDCEALGPIPETIAKPQLLVYDMCIQRYRAKHQWMAFIDVDEFLVIKNATVASLPQLLSGFTDYGALAVNWQIFGASGHASKPEGSTLGSYTACYPEHDPENRHVKSIVNMDYVYQPGRDPHHFMYYEGKYAVNSAGEEVLGARASGVVTDSIVLNHYVTKSLEQYQQKMQRGSGMGNRKSMEFFQLTQLMATQNCTYAVHLSNPMEALKA